jgi:hypothetical protein
VIDKIEIGLDAPSNDGIGELLCDTFSVDFVRDLFAELGEVALTVGVLDVTEEIGALTHEVVATAQEIASSTHAGGIDVGFGQHPCPEQASDVASVDAVVFDLGTMDGFHIKGVTKDEGDLFALTEIGEPVPGEHALDSNDDVVAVGTDGLEEWLGFGTHVPMSHDLSVLVEDADVHRSGMEIDPAVEWVLLGIESHEVSSFV